MLLKLLFSKNKNVSDYILIYIPNENIVVIFLHENVNSLRIETLLSGGIKMATGMSGENQE